MFWAAVLLAVLAGAVTLQRLGPPAAILPGPSASAADSAPVAAPAGSAAIASVAPALHPPEPAATDATPVSIEPAPAPRVPAPAVLETAAAPQAPAAPSRSSVIASPNPALLEPSSSGAEAQRPRIAADGRMSMALYSRPIDPADRRPRVGMVVVGFGLAAADSSAAITALPGAITLGFSPYSQHPEALLKEARAQGHEYLVTLPMESQGYPLNQSGLHALLTGNSPSDNDRNLQWVLSRMQGEVGLTGASDGLRGERFEYAAVPFGVVLSELASRGLLYVDPRVGSPTRGSVIGVTMVIDDPPLRAEMDAKLAALEQQARDHGVAVGLAGPLRPATVERVAAWARALDGRGIMLVPVSALVTSNVQ